MEMMLQVDQIYRYRSLAAQRQGYCRLRIYARGSSHVVLLTEVPNNPGQSITAASEVIATGLVKRYRLDPAHTFWLEHWPADNNDTLTQDAYASVKYTWQDGLATDPHWRQLTLEQAEAKTGVRLQERVASDPLAEVDRRQHRQ
jgi:hypothetical protein